VSITYRGLIWKVYTTPTDRHLLRAWCVDSTPVCEWFVDEYSTRSLDQLATINAPHAVTVCKLRGWRAIDGVPWEIHGIEDEDAYQTALASYKDAMP